jgi:DNA polymerase-3 subunit gamma/tau
VAELERPKTPLRTEPALETSFSSSVDAAPAESAGSEVEPVKNGATVAQITGAPNIETLRLAVISALADGGHATAAQLLGAGAWSVDGSSLRIEVSGIGKKMLSLTVNAAAEKIIRQELQRLGAPARFLIVPVEGSATALAAAAPVAPAGSIQETALANPLVQRAKEIFKAEVRSVVDLRAR